MLTFGRGLRLPAQLTAAGGMVEVGGGHHPLGLGGNFKLTAFDNRGQAHLVEGHFDGVPVR